MVARANNGNTSRIDDLLASVTGDLLGDVPQAFQNNKLRADRILLEFYERTKSMTAKVEPQPTLITLTLSTPEGDGNAPERATALAPSDDPRTHTGERQATQVVDDPGTV